MIRHIILLLLVGLAWGQTSTSIKSKDIDVHYITQENSILNKQKFTIGFLDDRTDLSIL